MEDIDIERQNPHWEIGFSYPFELKRQMFGEIAKTADSGMITAIYGLRRTGKSVLAKQLINHSLEKGVPPSSILYYSFDEQKDDFWSIIAEFERRLKRRVGKNEMIVLDEIQRVDDWKGKIKRLYDTSACRIVLTGSNSGLLKKGGESLAGRIIEFTLKPLSFAEFLAFEKKENLADSGLGGALELEFWKYIERPFAELALKPELDFRQYAGSISKKVIYEDLPGVFPISEPELLHQIFEIICRQPGQALQAQSLGSDLGKDRKTISAYLEYLERGFLVRPLLNYSPNLLTSYKKSKKYYPSLPIFSADAQRAKLVETAVAQALDARYFWNDRNRYEVDFILPSPLRAVEVKYKRKIMIADFRGLLKFKAKYPEAREILVGATDEMGAVPFWEAEKILKS